MKTITRFTTLCAVLALALSTSAADMLKYRGAFRGSKVRIEGTSNIHDWTAESVIVRGNLELDPSFPADPSSKDLKPGKVEVEGRIAIVVATFKCSSGAAMDSVMQEKMEATKYPTIEYKLKELVFKEFKDDVMLFDSTGDLTVHGQTKTISMPVEITRPDARTIKVTGTVGTKMTDFGMEPPAPKIALGIIKTGDEVKLIVEWTAQRVGG